MITSEAFLDIILLTLLLAHFKQSVFCKFERATRCPFVCNHLLITSVIDRVLKVLDRIIELQ